MGDKFNKLNWGILSTAKIAREKMLPAIRASQSSQVLAVASRDQAQADKFAKQENIPTAYGDYQQLLDDPNIDVIYNALPNHLHIPWTLKAIEAGKHVLCEKPIGLNSPDVEVLIAATKKRPELKVMEAFMYRFHLQWLKAKQLIDQDKIGKIHNIDAVFTYHNIEPNNVRNIANIGGGSLLDIGCYCISVARYLLAKEPTKVIGELTFDEDFGVDKHAHALLNFGDVNTSLYCSTQSDSSQYVHVSGERGSFTIEQPFYQLNNANAQLRVKQKNVEKIYIIESCNHYVEQIEALASAINNNQPVPTPLTDALANMKVIDAIFSSDKSNAWVNIEK